MSDTPRTDAGLEYDDTTVDDVKDFARTLERELNKANERIKNLKSALCTVENIDKVNVYQDLESTNERIKRLEEALEGTLNWIVYLANSGDAGFWNPEEQSVIIAARAALKKEAKP
jgi:predicted  nucleic acid-binding Zn-ribbon protein